MFCLPYSSADGCSSQWHYHFHKDLAEDHFPIHTLMSGDCDSMKVLALLRILNSTDVAESLLKGVAGLQDWQVADSFQRLTYYTPRYWAPVVAATVHAVADTLGMAGQCLSYDDIHCHSCGEYVSKVLDREHWDSLCATCSYHSDECECCEQCGYNPCECCQTCNEVAWHCSCCSYCQQPEGYCECEVCENCEEIEPHCSCGSHSGHSFGSTSTAPWLNREDLAEPMALPRIADCRNGDIDPVQAAADFYLLDAIKNLVRLADVKGASDEMHLQRNTFVRADSMLSALVTSAERSYRNLVDYLAPNFLAYALPAVGGELRYHRCAGKAMKAHSRETAWDKFVEVVEAKGAETLFEADKLFLEFGNGAYGGKKWGDAAKVVGQYLAGTMPAWLFVDRVFTLQHNGGCFLNKVNWKRSNGLTWGLSKILYVLNAHAGKDASGSEDAPTDWALLCRVASPEVAAMFRMTERHLSRIARRFGGTLEPVSKSHILKDVGRYC